MPIYYPSISESKTLILLTYIPLGPSSVCAVINLTCLLYSLNTKTSSISITIFIINLIVNSALIYFKFLIAFKILLLFKARSNKKVFTLIFYITSFKLYLISYKRVLLNAI